MSVARFPLWLATVLFLLRVSPATADAAPACPSDSASEAEEACHLQLPRSQEAAATAEKAPVVILDKGLRGTWGYASNWASGETDEWVYKDPCNKTHGLSWHADIPYHTGITLSCLKEQGCHDQFRPHDKGGFRYLNFKVYVPPGSHGTCGGGDVFGQSLSDSLAVQLFGERKSDHSMPIPMNRNGDGTTRITHSAGGMYWICVTIPHMQQNPYSGEWARISVENWPMDTASHQGSFELYLDYVSLADACL